MLQLTWWKTYILSEHMQQIEFFTWLLVSFFFKDFIYLFLERGEGKGKERERNINVRLPLTCPLTGNLACNPGLCLRLGIKPATLWFTGPHSIHWAMPARAWPLVSIIFQGRLCQWITYAWITREPPPALAERAIFRSFFPLVITKV